jgi:hypothetical protein
MSTQLRNVPNCRAQNELTQTRFWGGADRMTCLQVTQVKPKSERTTSGSADFFNHLSLTRHQARRLAVELMLFAEEREVEEFEEEDLLARYPDAVAQVEVLKKDFL